MKIYKRSENREGERTAKISYFGYNSNGVFTIKLSYEKEESDELINLEKEEFQKLKKFIGEIK